MKKYVLLFLLSWIPTGLLGFFLSTPAPIANFQNLKDSSRLVIASDLMHHGSGTILKSGNILSCLHVFDVDEDDLLSSDERYVFYLNSSGDITSGTIVWPIRNVKGIDAVIIQPSESLVSSIELSSTDVLPGSQLFSIGFPLGESPTHMTFGHRSFDDEDGFKRASLNVFGGMSGGGVYSTNNGDMLGIIIAGRRNDEVPVIPHPEWAEYLSSGDIRDAISLDGMIYLVDGEPDVIAWALIGIYAVFAVYILFGAICIAYCIAKAVNHL